MKTRIKSAAATIAEGTEKRTVEEALNQYVVHSPSLPIRTSQTYSFRICISPQCGFASHSEGNPVTEEDVVKKLSLVVKVAKEVWPNDA